MPRKEIAGFKVEYLQILDEKGQVDEQLEPDLTDEQLLALYRAMLHAREADQRMLKLQRTGRLGTFSPATGQEAASVGPAFALERKDWFVGAFRELGGRLLRGVPFTMVLQFWNGFEEGTAYGAEDRTPPDAIIVGAQIPQGVGMAYALKYREEKQAALIFFGDGATSEGDFHEGLNFAGVWQAPAVFVCQNNQWAISVPRSMQTHSATIAQKAIAYGMPGIQVDGNDVLAMYAATKEALELARSGGGPTLIEAVTYRLSMHTTADDPTRYREAAEAEGWQAKDPLTRFRVYLEGKGLMDDARHEALHESVKAQVAASVQEFESMKNFKPDTNFDHVYGTRHDTIENQRAEFLDLIAREGSDG